MKKTKVLSLLMATIMTVSNFSVSVFANDDDVKTLTILSTADLHGRIYPWEYATDSEQEVGLAKIATLIEEERQKDPNLLLVDNGDTIESNMIDLFNDDDIHPMVKAMNMLEYDAWTIGNHEFNFGLDVLNNAIEDFEGDALAANVIKTEDGTDFVHPYVMKDYDGVSIALVGMLVPHIERWEASTPEHYEGLEFLDPLQAAQDTIDEINENEDADLVIAVFHMGLDGENYDPNLTDSSRTIFEEVEGYDAAFLAHAHSYIGGADEQVFVNDTIIAEPGSNGKNLAKLQIDVVETEDGYEVVEKRTDLLSVSGVEPNQEILEAFEYVDTRSKESAYEVIGYTDEDFLPEEEFKGIPIAQTQDTAVIDLINEVQMFYSDADVSGAALFDTRSNLEKGEIQFKDAALIYKYSNTLQGHKITGKQLKDYMEWSATFYNTTQPGDVTVSFNEDIRGYNYDMFAGVDYKIDIAKEPGSRIVDLTFKGEEVSDDMELVLAVNNYRVGTLQGLGILPEDGSSVVFDSTATPTPEMQRLIAKYLLEEKDGEITPEVDNNWELLNAPNNEEEIEMVQYLVNNEYISIPRSEDGRTANVKSINLLEMLPAIDEIELLQSEKLTSQQLEILTTYLNNKKAKTYGDFYEFAYETLTTEMEVVEEVDVIEEVEEVEVIEIEEVEVIEVEEVEVTEEVAVEKPEMPTDNSYVYYTVVSGDTLSEIAVTYNTYWQYLASINEIANPDLIYPGDMISVPSK